MNRLVIFGVAAAIVAGDAAAQQVKPDLQIRMRKAAYDVMDYALEVLDNMVEGKRPYAKDEAVRNAELVARVAHLPKNFFGEGSDSNAGETRAKPEIWTHRADFDAKMDKMIQETGKLPAAAASGDVATLRKAVEAAGDACKACHDDYRAKRRR